MNRGESDERRTGVSTKAAIKIYGDRFHEDNSSLKKSQMKIEEKSYSRTRELHMAKRDIGRLKGTRDVADSMKAQAESELFDAKRTVRDLSSLIRKSDSKTKARKQETETLRKSTRHEGTLAFVNVENYKYAEVIKELETVKQELRMLKLDMAAILAEKLRAENQIKAATSRISSCSSSMEAVKKEIEEANEEHVLVELARIEALKECEEIEAEREKEAVCFSSAIEKTRKKIKGVIDDIEESKELQPKLDATMADVEVLQNELMLVKEMEQRAQRNKSMKGSEASSQGGETDLDASLSLQTVTKELEAAQQELTLVKEEGFQYMASMDIIRNELKHVRTETARFEEIEKNRELTVQNLNSKLLRAKSKLESVTAAERKAKSIAANLSITLEKLKVEAEAAKKEKRVADEEAATMKAEVHNMESDIDITEEKLQAAMLELEAVKSSEALALENLKSLIENTMGARSSSVQHSSSITISKFEYEYLTGHAIGAEELADKKVAAAKAWAEAIKASEKEILMKTDLVQREIREMRMEEKRESYGMERSISAKDMVEKEFENWRNRREKNATPENLQLALHKRSIRGNNIGTLTPSRRATYRKSASPGSRNSFLVKKKRQVIPDLAKFFKTKPNKNL
ncbi:protein PLASTID MOVEMENT IMPAIRED 15 [Humulus lupulus]|uniref:protein PLASTID MOVEMENT IMPAIRED 15 n=1 Tax=Humulus lupulus TaxID=3486 RepID=UPI002B4110CF|nr:protein PLASTID MOVEMENT IMPAIRED 15 [Humulus lupulus]